jgi:serine/threonine protein kinase
MSDEGTERQPTPSNPGEQLPFPNWERYKLIAFLGAGGMGSVYKAFDPRLDRHIAVKFLRSTHLATDQNRQRRRFEREARAQASIDHPHICKIYGGCRNSGGWHEFSDGVILFLILRGRVLRSAARYHRIDGAQHSEQVFGFAASRRRNDRMHLA